MEKRQLGKTDMQVSVLGFGGAEIGFEGVTEQTVERLLKSALDAGLNVIVEGEDRDRRTADSETGSRHDGRHQAFEALAAFRQFG